MAKRYREDGGILPAPKRHAVDSEDHPHDEVLTATQHSPEASSASVLATTTPQLFRFLDLPKEIRLMIYERLPTPEKDEVVGPGVLTDRTCDMAILRVCRQIHAEAHSVILNELRCSPSDPFLRMKLLGDIDMTDAVATLIKLTSAYFSNKKSVNQIDDEEFGGTAGQEMYRRMMILGERAVMRKHEQCVVLLRFEFFMDRVKNGVDNDRKKRWKAYMRNLMSTARLLQALSKVRNIHDVYFPSIKGGELEAVIFDQESQRLVSFRQFAKIPIRRLALPSKPPSDRVDEFPQELAQLLEADNIVNLEDALQRYEPTARWLQWIFIEN